MIFTIANLKSGKLDLIVPYSEFPHVRVSEKLCEWYAVCGVKLHFYSQEKTLDASASVIKKIVQSLFTKLRALDFKEHCWFNIEDLCQ